MTFHRVWYSQLAAPDGKRRAMKRLLLLVAAGFSITLVVFVSKSSTNGPRDNAEFTYMRIRYHMTPEGMRMNELPWHHDFPFGDETFPTILGEVTNVKANAEAYKTIDIDSPDLFK